MIDIAGALQQGAFSWLFIPSAILLGALHGLEPGHSKTMMAAFIVAVRGTVGQAVLLGLAATVSHTAVVWGIALGGMYLGRGLDAETSEPYFQLASAALVIAIALWMLHRTWQERRRAKLESGGRDHHQHGTDHRHGADVRRIDTGHGVIALEIFEDGAPPRWRLRDESGHGWAATEVTLEIERLDGRSQSFAFVERDGYLESADEIPEPHEFMARVRLAHGGHVHDYDVAYVENCYDHDHDHIHEEMRGLQVATGGYQDAHELAHASDIRRRFADRNVTTAQIVLFGLTGGLIPCPAAITVLLLCLQLKEIPLGALLVLCFSVGLAITLVTVGAAAALSVRHVSDNWSWVRGFAQHAPYLSGALIVAVGVYLGIQGWIGLG